MASPFVSWNSNGSNTFVVITKDIKTFSRTEDHKIILKEKFDLPSPPKCFSWNPKYFVKDEGCLALGLQTGNLLLYDLQTNEIIKEFGNRSNQRASQVISWNPIQSNYIAVGFEKSKNTSSLCIWDYNTRGERYSATNSKDQYFLNSKSIEYISVPQFEFNTNFEPTSALTWIPNQHTCLFAGILKNIKLFDFRDSTKKASTSWAAHNTIVKGIHFDPNDSTKFLSFEDNLIKMWDTRKLDTLKTIKVGSNIIYENLASLSMISSFEKNELKLWDLSDGKRLPFKYSTFKNITVPDGIQSISFHPTHPNDMVIYKSNDTIEILENGTVKPIAFSSLDLHGVETKKESIEISDLMYFRAQKGFGMDISKNISISHEIDPDRAFLWKWIEKWKNINKHMEKKLEQYIYPGSEILLGDFAWVKTTKVKATPEMSGFVTFDRNGPNQIFDWLENDDTVDASTRTFAKHIFNLSLKKSINVLTSLENPFYKYLAFALFKYSPETKESFKDLFQNEKLDDPYIRASIGFLKNNDFSAILYENGIPFSDRMAFALKYLTNDQLMQYCTKSKEYFKEQGDLQGILLTGLTSLDTIQLLSNYVDRTNDVQTAAVLMTQLPIKDRQAIVWLETLRDLMDKWKLWEQRAMFDIELTKFKSIDSHSIMIKCKFCNQSISNAPKAPKQRTFRKYGGTTVAQTSACPNCTKPLPSCSICEMSYGSSCYAFGESSNNKFNSLEYTFVWCVQCKHAGHMKHLSEWFENHSKCPVPGCECGCKL